ncbi:Ubiquitin-like domain-containing protein [Mycena sanguinolenta]|uniref:Ubiquitin-like domain-containing protein n=1 Tax=Mycena sanguinolenta TaxID=230812 RepID=A0A8H7CGQ2_9AGAR|nr:Ubiquitin-like domain-containing protein [Mycena sanguinolenta]
MDLQCFFAPDSISSFRRTGLVSHPAPARAPPDASTTNITLTSARDITTLDADADHAGLPSEEISTYNVKLAEPEIWRASLTFLSSHIPSPADAARALADFLRASRNTLTASEAAPIRATVGISGIAGQIAPARVLFAPSPKHECVDLVPFPRLVSFAVLFPSPPC